MCKQFTVAQLREQAAKKGIELPTRILKKDLCELLLQSSWKAEVDPCKALTVPKLKAIAAERGIELPKRVKKQEVCDALKRSGWNQQTQVKQEPVERKPVPKPLPVPPKPKRTWQDSQVLKVELDAPPPLPPKRRKVTPKSPMEASMETYMTPDMVKSILKRKAELDEELKKKAEPIYTAPELEQEMERRKQQFELAMRRQNLLNKAPAKEERERRDALLKQRLRQGALGGIRWENKKRELELQAEARLRKEEAERAKQMAPIVAQQQEEERRAQSREALLKKNKLMQDEIERRKAMLRQRLQQKSMAGVKWQEELKKREQQAAAIQRKLEIERLKLEAEKKAAEDRRAKILARAPTLEERERRKALLQQRIRQGALAGPRFEELMKQRQEEEARKERMRELQREREEAELKAKQLKREAREAKLPPVAERERRKGAIRARKARERREAMAQAHAREMARDATNPIKVEPKEEPKEEPKGEPEALAQGEGFVAPDNIEPEDFEQHQEELRAQQEAHQVDPEYNARARELEMERDRQQLQKVKATVKKWSVSDVTEGVSFFSKPESNTEELRECDLLMRLYSLLLETDLKTQRDVLKKAPIRNFDSAAVQFLLESLTK